MAHTPTPWIVDPAYPSEVQTSTDETICSAWHEHAVGAKLTITGVLPCSLEESAANAAFIVRAVNAYEANEALIKELREDLAHVRDGIQHERLSYAVDAERIETLIKELVEALEFSRGSIFENNHFKDVAEVIDAALAKAETCHAL